MYHAISSGNMNLKNREAGAELYSVSLENFHEQVEYLYQNDYIVTDIENIYKNPRGKKQVALTFDDGDLSNYKIAYPVLREFGFHACFFIIAGSIGKNGIMGWEHMKDLRSHGNIIGSHGMSHEILTTMNKDELDYELRTSKQILEKNLGEEIKYLSIPRGMHNKLVLRDAKECGYEKVFTSVLGKNDFTRNEFALRRIAVGKDWDIKKFKSVLKEGLSLGDRTADFIKKSSRAILGVKNYDKIRTSLLKNKE